MAQGRRLSEGAVTPPAPFLVSCVCRITTTRGFGLSGIRREAVPDRPKRLAEEVLICAATVPKTDALCREGNERYGDSTEVLLLTKVLLGRCRRRALSRSLDTLGVGLGVC